MIDDTEDDVVASLAQRAKIIGGLIRDARQMATKTTEECAQVIGVSQETFENYEAGKHSLSLPELEGIAYFLDVPLEYFWDNKPLSAKSGFKKYANMQQLISLRHRMIGAQIRQARMEVNLSLDALARRLDLDASLLDAYELGQEAVPLTILERLSSMVNRSIKEFYDRHGPIGTWVTQQRAIQDFVSMPLDLQAFVSKPINRPYLELAVRLSEMSVDRLRAVAEGLLEITY
jgi:transcriptional regulator with XRE-family HTH domain